MKRATFSILFFAKKNKPLKDGNLPLYVRLTINGRSRETSLGLGVPPKIWDPSWQRAKGRSYVAEEINNSISEIESDLRLKRRQLLDTQEPVTAEALMDAHKGVTAKQWMILELFRADQARFLELVKNGHHSMSTYKRYETTLSHLGEFIWIEYRSNDLDCNKVDLTFINQFEHFLKVSKKCSHNSALKHIKGLRKVVLKAVNQDLMRKDPFHLYKMHTEHIEKQFLTQSELDRIYQKPIYNERLSTVRDMFLFQCYTGMAYCDIKGLKSEHIIKADDGMYWIIKSRMKTGKSFRIPLLPKAEEILFRYASARPRKEQNLLPMSSNQKMNAYLKEIAVLCDIDKNLTTHLGRHTFATTVALNNNISQAVLQRMMGVTKASTLDIYAKMLDTTISKQMKALRDLH